MTGKIIVEGCSIPLPTSSGVEREAAQWRVGLLHSPIPLDGIRLFPHARAGESASASSEAWHAHGQTTRRN